MQIATTVRNLKHRFADATGAVTEEYVLTSLVATGIVTLLVKLLESSATHEALQGMLLFAINTLPKMFA